MTAIRILLADDNILCREGLARLLDVHEELTVIGEAGDPSQVLALVKTHQPDIVLLCLDMPDQDLDSTIHTMRLRSARTKILVLSMQDDPVLVRRALRAGAHGYVTMNMSGAELIAAIHAVQRDSTRAMVSISRESLARYGDGMVNPLTPREVEILGLAAEALTNGQIANRLGIAESTVKRHLTNAYARLGADSRIDAINKAVAFGIIRPPVTDSPRKSALASQP